MIIHLCVHDNKWLLSHFCRFNCNHLLGILKKESLSEYLILSVSAAQDDPSVFTLKFRFIVILAKFSIKSSETVEMKKNALRELPLGWRCLFSRKHSSLSCHAPFVLAEMLGVFSGRPFRWNNSHHISYPFCNRQLLTCLWVFWFLQPFLPSFLFFWSLKNISKRQNGIQIYPDTIWWNCTCNNMPVMLVGLMCIQYCQCVCSFFQGQIVDVLCF